VQTTYKDVVGLTKIFIEQAQPTTAGDVGTESRRMAKESRLR